MNHNLHGLLETLSGGTIKAPPRHAFSVTLHPDRPREPPYPAGARVLAQRPLARPRLGEAAEVIGITPGGDNVLRVAGSDMNWHAHPGDLAPADEIDDEPL